VYIYYNTYSLLSALIPFIAFSILFAHSRNAKLFAFFFYFFGSFTERGQCDLPTNFLLFDCTNRHFPYLVVQIYKSVTMILKNL